MSYSREISRHFVALFYLSGLYSGPEKHTLDIRTPLRIAVILLLAGGLFAEKTRDFLTLPLSPLNAALAGQVAHNIPVQAAATVNPAFLGYGSQNAFFAGGFYGSALSGFFANGALYSPFGGIGFGVEYLKAEDKTVAAHFSYGSFLTRRIATGLSLMPRYTSDGSAAAFGFGIDPALIFDSKWHMAWGTNDGFGIYSPSVFFRTQNLAIPIGETSLLALPSAHVGMMSGFFQSTNLNGAVVISTHGSDRFDRVPLHMGVQMQYRWLLFSLGYGMNSFVTTGNGWSLGAGAQMPFSFGDAFLFYSLSLAGSGRSDLHAFNAGLRFGGIDTDPPEVSFTGEGKSFSPNNDGLKDLMIFTAEVKDKSPIVYYEFRIRDAKGNMVYRLKGDERIREKDFSFRLFFRSFVAPRGRADIPEKFTWNGRSMDAAKVKVVDQVFEDRPEEKVLPDGAYTYEFWVIDEKNNESRHVTGEIQIDTRPPVVSVELDDDLISPNGDGRRDILTITQDISAHDSYEGVIVNAAGEQVRHFSWAENPPTRVDFDGLNDFAAPVAEGVYRYKLTGRDAAGNRSEKISNNFYLTRRVDSLTLKSSGLGLNPTQKPYAELQLTPETAFADGYIDGVILIRRECSPKNEDLVAKIPVEPPKKEKGKVKMRSYAWRGEAVSSTRAGDGNYCAVFQARYENGNIPESPPIRFVLDTTAPEIDVSADLSVRQFTPDADGENEEQAFRLSVKELSGIASYTLTIDELLMDNKGEKKPVPVRRFQGQGEIPHTIYWDGRAENGALVDSLTQYEYTLTATDIYGNKATTTQRRFETGILAVASGNGFFIRLPAAAPESRDMLYRLLSKYPKYKIKIEVHAALGVGIEKTLTATETAARGLYEFLVAEGIPADRVSYQGFGDSTPAYNPKGPLAAKNARVDILLSR